MILPKNCNFRRSVPLRFTTQNFHKRGFLLNKQTIFFRFLTVKSFVLSYMFMDGGMRKNHILKQCKNSSSCFSLKSLLFRVVILYRGVEWSNFIVLPPGMVHMARNDPNYWFLMKYHDVKKVYYKSVN
jgi:hypothetical protein